MPSTPRHGRTVAPAPPAAATKPAPMNDGAAPGAGGFFGGLLTRSRTVSDEDVRRMKER